MSKTSLSFETFDYNVSLGNDSSAEINKQLKIMNLTKQTEVYENQKWRRSVPADFQTDFFKNNFEVSMIRWNRKRC